MQARAASWIWSAHTQGAIGPGRDALTITVQGRVLARAWTLDGAVWVAVQDEPGAQHRIQQLRSWRPAGRADPAPAETPAGPDAAAAAVAAAVVEAFGIGPVEASAAPPEPGVPPVTPEDAGEIAPAPASPAEGAGRSGSAATALRAEAGGRTGDPRSLRRRSMSRSRIGVVIAHAAALFRVAEADLLGHTRGAPVVRVRALV